jgi:hypothetical protein
MAKLNCSFLIVLASLTIASLACADVVYVDANSPGDPGTGTSLDPYRRIQDAIYDPDTGSGDIIEIRPGVYTGPGNYNIDPNGFAITIRSIDPDDPDIVSSTIIDPNCAGRAFELYKGESRDCVIAGLTIRNGYTFFGTDGGAIICTQDSSPTIRNCVIENCEAIVSGGGIYSSGGNPYIINCLIKDNSAQWYGGGLSFAFCNQSGVSEIIGCTITGNTADFEGGALDLGQSNVTLTNCVIAGNDALSNGGGINCFLSSNLSVINCTMAGNGADSSGGGLYCQYGSTAQVKNSIIRANEASQGPQVSLPYFPDNPSTASISYSNVRGGQAGVFVESGSTLAWSENNIAADPNFAVFGPGIGSELWDFHLSSEAGRWDANIQDWVQDQFTSPCIDAGDPNSDSTSEPWPHGGRINMGAYGNTSQASMNGNIADFNIDGIVNLIDFVEFSERWLSFEACIEDLTGEGQVDEADIVIMAHNWMWQKQ